MRAGVNSKRGSLTAVARVKIKLISVEKAVVEHFDDFKAKIKPLRVRNRYLECNCLFYLRKSSFVKSFTDQNFSPKFIVTLPS